MKKLRTKRFIHRGVQLRVVLIALGVASLVLLVNFQLIVHALSSVSSDTATNPGAAKLLDDFRAAVFRAILVSIVVSIPLSGAIGIAYSFKFAGPIYAIGRYFRELKAGHWTKRCHLRKNDDLHDLRDDVNNAMDPIMEFLGENRAALAEARRLIGDAEVREGEATKERAEAVLARLDAIEHTFTERLSEPDSPKSPVTETAPAAEQVLEPQA